MNASFGEYKRTEGMQLKPNVKALFIMHKGF